MWVSRGIALYPQNGGQAAVVDAWAVHGIWWIRVDQVKKEVRKRRASIYRTSPSDAVEHFLVSHVTGWAILGYPGLELDTGIFPFVLFLDTVLPPSSNLNLKKKCRTGKRAWCKAFEFLSGFRLATRVLERQWTLAPLYRWYK